MRSHLSVTWERDLAAYPASNNISARDRRRGAGLPEHLNPSGCSLFVRSPPLLLLQYPSASVYPIRCVPSGKLPFCHSVPWDFLPLHGLSPCSNFQVCTTRLPRFTAGGYTLVNAAGHGSSGPALKSRSGSERTVCDCSLFRTGQTGRSVLGRR
jgi:hypothetical protein